MRTEIILIGPARAGKTTLGRLLARRLRLPRRSADKLRMAYYHEIGYDDVLADRLVKEQGFLALYRYWKPFEIHALERILSEHYDCVFDLGAGHSVYEDDALFRRAQQALAPFANVILLLPSPDVEESVRVLDERTGYEPSMGFNLNRHFIIHHSNHDLATLTVYTHGQTPKNTCETILGRLQAHRPGSS